MTSSTCETFDTGPSINISEVQQCPHVLPHDHVLRKHSELVKVVKHPSEENYVLPWITDLLFFFFSLLVTLPTLVCIIPTILFVLFVKYLIVSIYEFSFFTDCLRHSELRWIHSNTPIMVLLQMQDKQFLVKETLNDKVVESSSECETIGAQRGITFEDTVRFDNSESQKESLGHEHVIGKIRTLLKTRIIEAINSEGKYVFPRFRQCIMPTLIGYKWVTTSNYKADNYITEQRVPSRKDIYAKMQELATMPAISKIGSALWDIHIFTVDESKHGVQIFTESPSVSSNESFAANTHVPPVVDVNGCGKKCLTGEESTIILLIRLHPCLSDGVSLVQLFSKIFSDQKAMIYMKPRFSSYGKIVNWVRCSFSGVFVFLDKWVFLQKQCLFNNFSKCRLTTESGSTVEMQKPHFDNRTTVYTAANSDSETKNYAQESSSITIATNTPKNICKLCNPTPKYTYTCKILDMSQINRIKLTTGCVLNDLFLAVTAGALRVYQQIGGINIPQDLLTLLPVDLTSSDSYDEQNSEADTNYSMYPDCDNNVMLRRVKLRNSYTINNTSLVSNIEGVIPRLWQTEVKTSGIKNTAECIAIDIIDRFLHLCLPSAVCFRLLHQFYNKAFACVSNLQGPGEQLCFAGKEIESLFFWFPIIQQIDVYINFFTYNNLLCIGLCVNTDIISDCELLMTSIVKQFEILSQLIEHRRIPGKHRALQRKSNIELELGQKNISSCELQNRLMCIQGKLQNTKKYSKTQIQGLKTEFSDLMRELRRRKSIGYQTENGESGDFDEEFEEVVQERRSSSSRRRRISFANFASPTAGGLDRRRSTFTQAVMRRFSMGHNSLGRTQSNNSDYKNRYVKSASNTLERLAGGIEDGNTYSYTESNSSEEISANSSGANHAAAEDIVLDDTVLDHYSSSSQSTSSYNNKNNNKNKTYYSAAQPLLHGHQQIHEEDEEEQKNEEEISLQGVKVIFD